MKFSEHWLRTFVDPALTSRELADVLTMSGLEVEALEPAAAAFDGVVVAKVLAVESHPAAERLKVCRVDAGGAPVQIVCGAPSVTAGMRVPLAQVGARLVGGAQIAAAQVRGIESHGMLCSAADLGISDDASGLLVLAADAPVGADLRSHLDLDDQLLTIKLTPNRGDCLGVFGIAREAAAVTGAVLEPVAAAPVPPQVTDVIEIALEAGAACPRYRCARRLAGALLDEVRAVVGQIRVQPVDLRATLQSLTEGLAALRVNLVIPDDLGPLDADRADAVLRCVQELITNTLRHAQARELVVEIQQTATGLLIRARDDGRGGESVEGHGLAGMRERFESLGGNLSISSAPGRGFSVDGYIPVAVT